jgi:hypothetical protein
MERFSAGLKSSSGVSTFSEWERMMFGEENRFGFFALYQGTTLVGP